MHISSLECASTSSTAVGSSSSITSSTTVGSSSSMHHAKTSSLDSAFTSFIEERATTPNSIIDTSKFSTDERETTSTNEIVEPQTQCISSQYSSETFMAEMQKKFAFYKCDKLTINFNQNYKRKRE